MQTDQIFFLLQKQLSITNQRSSREEHAGYKLVKVESTEEKGKLSTFCYLLKVSLCMDCF